jgi:hypothetical protein
MKHARLWLRRPREIKLTRRAQNEMSMDVKTAIENGDAEALRELLSQDSSRANKLIESATRRNA